MHRSGQTSTSELFVKLRLPNNFFKHIVTFFFLNQVLFVSHDIATFNEFYQWFWVGNFPTEAHPCIENDCTDTSRHTIDNSDVESEWRETCNESNRNSHTEKNEHDIAEGTRFSEETEVVFIASITFFLLICLCMTIKFQMFVFKLASSEIFDFPRLPHVDLGILIVRILSGIQRCFNVPSLVAVVSDSDIMQKVSWVLVCLVDFGDPIVLAENKSRIESLSEDHCSTQ